ncbi:MAG TPA: hypothetical protein VGE62_01080 [Candidatus Paceibacterota bacterium]
MLPTILQDIRTKLAGVSSIKEIYGYPLEGNPKKFPAAIFFFDRFDNSFSTVADNFKVLNFKLYLVINSSGTSVETIQESVMPKLIDAVVSKFDAEWNGGTINGHRVWSLITGGELSVSVEQKGKTVTADLTIQVKLSTQN